MLKGGVYGDRVVVAKLRRADAVSGDGGGNTRRHSHKQRTTAFAFCVCLQMHAQRVQVLPFANHIIISFSPLLIYFARFMIAAWYLTTQNNTSIIKE